jgi:hypothetical protein
MDIYGEAFPDQGVKVSESYAEFKNRRKREMAEGLKEMGVEDSRLDVAD